LELNINKIKIFIFSFVLYQHVASTSNILNYIYTTDFFFLETKFIVKKLNLNSDYKIISQCILIISVWFSRDQRGSPSVSPLIYPTNQQFKCIWFNHENNENYFDIEMLRDY